MNRAGGAIDQRDELRKGVAEETRDAQRHVNTRAGQNRKRQDLEPGDAAVCGVPGGFHAHKGKGLGDVVAACAHIRGAPGGEEKRARPVAVGLQVLFDQKVGGFPPKGPGGAGWDSAAVDRKEIAPGGKCVQTAPRGRAGWRRGDKAPWKGGEEARIFARPTGDEVGLDRFADHRHDGGTGRAGGAGRTVQKRGGKGFQPFNRVAVAAPGCGVEVGQRSGPWSGPWG